MRVYRHTQRGDVVIWSLAASAVGAAALALATPADAPTVARMTPLAVAFVLLATLALFSTLTVEVTEDAVSLRFGPGLVRKTIPVAEIRAAVPVRNRWWYGWGIHRTPRGWLYNVSGMEAVELELATGRHLRIGTDDPEALAGAIREAMRRGGPAT